MDKVSFLKGTQLFQDLTDEELGFVIRILKVARYEPEEFIFLEGDTADAAYVVVKGEVRFTKQVAADVEKTVFIARAGEVFGEMGVLEHERRSATAQAVGEVAVVWVGDKVFDELITARPEVGAKVLGALARLLSSRLRQTTELYSAAVAWGAEIAGLSRLEFSELIGDCRTVELLLRGDRSFRGRIVRADPETRDLTLQTADGALIVIPHHAIDALRIEAVGMGEAAPPASPAPEAAAVEGE